VTNQGRVSHGPVFFYGLVALQYILPDASLITEPAEIAEMIVILNFLKVAALFGNFV
jgi:hypothetical protein